MATKPRSSGGCWTCRLRRKKCDEERPLCKGCLALEIDCLYGEDKPEWMDGAEKQKQKVAWLKKQVKRKATHRRERRYLQGLEVRLESLDASLTDDSDTVASRDLINAAPMSVDTVDSSTSSAGTKNSTPTSGLDGAVTDSSLPALSPDEHSGGGFGLPLLNAQAKLSQEAEAHSTMMYLDYVFPFLFPFYRPSFADVGRGWLLVLLTKNKALFHSALSLAGYFYAIVLGLTRDAPSQCRTHNLETLHEQQGLALRWLQREMQDIITRGVKGNLADANRVMASIIQLMTCDVAIAKPANWTMHLGAATELFNEIMKHHAITESGHTCFMIVLLQLGSRPFAWTPKNHPWGSDQAILRFFAAHLLFLDTLASTALQQPPRLQQWRQHLLQSLDEEARKHLPDSEKEHTIPHINLVGVVGVENWVIISIGEIAALDSWKKEMKRLGSLSVAELVARASAIEQRIRLSFQEFEEACAEQDGSGSVDGPQHLLQYFAGSFSPTTMHGTALNTRIWAHATISYLNIVVSGWQPSSPEIRVSVTQTIEMLLSLPTHDCLRTLVWPFTVTGCLAAPDQEQIFRDMFAGMGPLRVFGATTQGFAIMEKVWKLRADGNQDQWDIAACLNCLGQPALLI
ncbi:fungal-specific transcription factor domain-containing protein [Chaetomidium leptoderma]|uniref:Fungal-specific transcription factor domain-containing protein n=1 Tax=Chaetomidium leptoderma TaxID=669021 RepID=A0AAN6ZZR2_9PEZI|nr:fungal-specific transcription factor domain-containing protein [Chaetomidium leptoderma]